MKFFSYVFRVSLPLNIGQRWVRLLFLSFALLLFGSMGSETKAQKSDITVEDYCRLTISLMELSLHEWQERVPVSAKVKGDRQKLETALKDAAKKYDDLRTAQYKQFGLDQKTYVHYATDHKAEIESYLEDNWEVKQAIEFLKMQIDDLIQQFEGNALDRPGGGYK